MKNVLFLLTLAGLSFSCRHNKGHIEPQPPVNYWKGKTIVWTGTSIPWSYGENSYPMQIGRYLEATVHNTSISGSFVVFFPPDSASKNPGIPGMAATWKQLTDVGFQHPYSYQSTIFEYKPDLIVIDHGQNDANWIIERRGEVNSTDIGTFFGAMNTIINACKVKFPDAKIMLTTPPVEFVYRGQLPDKTKRQQLLAESIREIAKAQSVELWDIMKLYGIKIEDQASYTTDNLHPNRIMVDSLAKEGYKLLLTKVKPTTIATGK